MSANILNVDDRDYAKYRSHAATHGVLFWGLGLENEVYLEAQDTHVPVTLDWLQDSRARWIPERYSVDYYSRAYRREGLRAALRVFASMVRREQGNRYNLPLLFNAYGMRNVDRHGEHATLRTPTPATEDEEATSVSVRVSPNPGYAGTSLWDDLCALDPFFVIQRESPSFLFDGDTVELVTRQFMGATVSRIMAEWASVRGAFEEHLRTALQRLGFRHALAVCRQNHGLATFWSTGAQYLAVCNTMTLHLNITLPTELDPATGRIADWPSFVDRHRRFVRLLQWFEPLWLALHGQPDFLSVAADCRRQFRPLAGASLRCALSRYIGVGTYDTEHMAEGKILTMKWREHPMAKDPKWWYNEFYQRGPGDLKHPLYIRLDDIGLDVNFHKHPNHGVELRMFDYLPDEWAFRRVVDTVVWLAGVSEAADGSPPDAARSALWNGLVARVMEEGRRVRLNEEERSVFASLVGKTVRQSRDAKTESLRDFYDWLVDETHHHYSVTDLFRRDQNFNMMLGNN